MRRRALGRPARPSLVGTAARTAVIAGTATAVSGKVAANQTAKAQASQSQVPAPPPPAAPEPATPAGVTEELVEQLKKLGELRDAGILTDEEFQAKKAQVLGI